MFLSPRGIQKSPRISILPWDSDRDARAYHPYVVPLYFMLSHALIADGASHLLVCHPSFSSNGQVPAPPTQEPPALRPVPFSWLLQGEFHPLPQLPRIPRQLSACVQTCTIPLHSIYTICKCNILKMECQPPESNFYLVYPAIPAFL